jgi:hypothetical protein
MEILIGKKHIDTPFVFVKARRCGSNSLNNWLAEFIGKENYLDLSGDNQFINYDIFDIIENDILAGPKVTFCRNPYTRVVAGYLADIWHYAPSLGVNLSDLSHPEQPPKEVFPEMVLDMTKYKMTEDKDIHIEAFTRFLDGLVDYHKGNNATQWWQVTLVNEPLFKTVLDNNPDNINFFDYVIKQEELVDTWPAVSKAIIGKETALHQANIFAHRHPHDKVSTNDFLYLLDANNNRQKIADNWSQDFECFGYIK